MPSLSPFDQLRANGNERWRAGVLGPAALIDCKHGDSTGLIGMPQQRGAPTCTPRVDMRSREQDAELKA
jgi:hypothetical protein